MSSTTNRPLRTGACGHCFLNRRLMAVCGTIVLLTIVGCIVVSSILDKQKTTPMDDSQSSLELMKRQITGASAAGGSPTEPITPIFNHELTDRPEVTATAGLDVVDQQVPIAGDIMGSNSDAIHSLLEATAMGTPLKSVTAVESTLVTAIGTPSNVMASSEMPSDDITGALRSEALPLSSPTTPGIPNQGSTSLLNSHLDGDITFSSSPVLGAPSPLGPVVSVTLPPL